jgi:hypothetical protein
MGQERGGDLDYREIDVTQWRHGREPVVSEFRRQHGDLRFTRDCPACNGRSKTDAAYDLGVVPCEACNGRGTVHDVEDVKLSQVRYAQSQVQNVMNYLAELRDEHGNFWLDDQNVEDGRTFERWQMIFQAKTSRVARNHLYYDGDDPGEAGFAEKGFNFIILRLPVQHFRAVDAAIHTFANTGQARFLAGKNARHYQRAFQRLTFLMPGVHSDLKGLRERLRREGGGAAS